MVVGVDDVEVVVVAVVLVLPWDVNSSGDDDDSGDVLHVRIMSYLFS